MSAIPEELVRKVIQSFVDTYGLEIRLQLSDNVQSHLGVVGEILQSHL